KATAELFLGLGPLVVGQELAPRQLMDLLLRKTRLVGHQGLIGTVLAGIDMAAWDALARHQEMSLCRLLGGTHRRSIAYAGTGYDGELETARQAEEWVKKGFKGVKAKIGYPTAAEDLAVVRAMRAAVGPDVELMVDYNQSLHGLNTIQRLEALDEEGLVWIEEPVLAHDYKTSCRVKDAINTPIQSGENWWGPADMQLALSADASDFVMPDVMKIGGVSGWLKAVDLAAAAGKQVSSHLWPELSAQLLAVGSTSHRLEYVDWWAEILAEPLQIEDGLTVLPDNLVGTGISWNQQKLDTYRI
ncbi:mandelate racemase, partial [Granulosicoccus sp.]